MNVLQNTVTAHLMITEPCRIKRQKGLHATNLNIPKNIDLQVGDRVFVGKIGYSSYWTIEEIEEKRQSSLSDFNYYRTKSSYTFIQTN